MVAVSLVQHTVPFDGSLDEVTVDLELLEKQKKQSTLLIQKVSTSLSAYKPSAIGTWEILLWLVEKGLCFWVFLCVLRNLYLIKITKIFFLMFSSTSGIFLGVPISS